MLHRRLESQAVRLMVTLIYKSAGALVTKLSLSCDIGSRQAKLDAVCTGE